MSFLVKICGITRPEDARQAVAAGADLIGLNFWRGSERFVEDKQAHEIVAAIPAGVLRVGVFVNAHPLVVTETMAELKLDRVQLHGDEIASSWDWLRPDQIIRAVRVRDQASLKDALAWEAGLFLYDSHADGYGGTGQRAPWDVVAAGARRPFLIAGGLNASNVAEAIAATRPDGVDVSSGVESARGIKDLRKLRAFIKQARAAAAKLKVS
ncbi:MAG: phosphoribosylanthranilate isomerase [Polyangia bacterium]|jgi:phosphoribosylanthranilate isomerase